MALMRNPILVLLLIVMFPGLLAAESAQDNRRIEEEKRDILAPTQITIYPQERPVSVAPESSELQYLKELVLKKVATTQDAIHILAILLGLRQEQKDYPAGLSFCREKGILPPKISDNLRAESPLRKGVAAYMFCRALGLRDSVWLRVFGTSQRYALRELVFEGIMPSGSVHESVSGSELVLIFANAAEYLADKNPGINRNKK